MSVTAVEHGQNYRIMSLSDQGFLDLANRVTEKGNKLMTWEGNTSNAQKYRVEVQDGSFFHLLSLCRKKGDPHRVVDESAEHGNVLYWDLNDGDSQLWYLEPAAPGSDNFLIKNKQSGKALSNQGRGEQVKCVAADANDVHQRWKLIISDHFQAGGL